MTDLLTALRSYPVRPGETVHEGHPAYLMARAADEIERLRADRDYWCDAFRYGDARRAARAAIAEQEAANHDR